MEGARRKGKVEVQMLDNRNYMQAEEMVPLYVHAICLSPSLSMISPHNSCTAGCILGKPSSSSKNI
jgi:hypothetical protein